MKTPSTFARFIFAVMAVSFACAATTAATISWSGADGAAALNWSDTVNWNGNVPPTIGDVAFFNTNGISASFGVGSPDNIVDANLAIGGLFYGDTNGIHNTVINPGITLTISNASVSIPLLSGTMTDAGDPVTLYNTISGTGGTLVINNTNVGSAIVVQQTSATQGDGRTTHLSTLDLSALDNFNATVGRILVAVQGQLNPVVTQVTIPDIFYPEGTILLAKTNLIQMAQVGTILGGQDGGNGAGQGGSAGLSGPAIVLGDASSVQATAIMRLGQTNAIMADTICVGRMKSSGTLSFNPAFVSPSFFLRGVSSNRVAAFLVADDSHLSTSTTGASACTGIVDLTGGSSDLMIDVLTIASGEQGNGTAPVAGIFILGGGVMNVNTLNVGYQNSAAANGVIQGTLSLNNASSLTVNNQIVLGRSLGGPVAPTGTLNINNSAVTAANGIMDQSGNSDSTITVANISTVTTAAIGTPAAPVGNLTIGDSTLNLAVTSQSAPVSTINLITDSSISNNTINITAISPSAALEGTITLIQSSTPIQNQTGANGGGLDFILGTLPVGYAGFLQANPTGTEVQLVLTTSPFTPNNWIGADISNHNTNWSDGLNWSSGVAPGANGPASFTTTASASVSALSTAGGGPGALVPSSINNVVDANFSILQLSYANTNGTYHNTYVSDNSSLNVTLDGLTVGSPSADFGNTSGNVTISGPAGALNVTNSNSIIYVGLGDGSPASTAHAVLDMSGLGTFNANVANFFVGVGGYNSGMTTALQPVGTVYLAESNYITASSSSPGANDFTPVAFEIGDAGDAQTTAGFENGISSSLYLGRTNTVFTDYLSVGRQWGSGGIFFNPAFANSTAYFRGVNGGPIISWNIGDGVKNSLTGGGGAGTNDFTGGAIDILVNTMNVGKNSPNSGATSTAVSGTLTFNAGTLAANTLNASVNSPNIDGNIYDYAVGTINVNGTGLLVAGNLNLGVTTGPAVGTPPSATLNINGGTVFANNLLPGINGTVSTVNINGGLMTVSNTVGSSAAPLTILNLTNATLGLGTSSGAGIYVGALNLDGVGGASNAVNVLSLPAIEQYPLTFTVIQSADPINLGGGVFNFKVGSLPPASPSYTATISESADHTAVLLTVLSGPVSVRGNVFWNGPDAANGNSINWSDAANWLLPPVVGIKDTAFFSNVGLAFAPGAASANNIVDTSLTIAGLTFGETNASSFHNTVINSGVTLTVSNTIPADVLQSGSQTDVGAAVPIAYNTISGSGGTLVVTDTNVGSAILVQQGSGASGTENHYSTLDLSALDNFKATVGRLLIGVQGFTNTIGQPPIANITRPAGTLFLAKTNLINLTQLGPIQAPIDLANGNGSGSASIAGPAICLGDAFGTPAGASGDVLVLGQTNAIFADTITVGAEKPTGTLVFNTNAFSSAQLYLRGASASRVALFYVADDSHVGSSTTGGSSAVDLSGGTSDLMIDTLGIARGETGSGSATINGTFTMGPGNLNVNTVYVGQLSTNTAGGNVNGTLNINSGGNLVVNNQLILAQWLSGGTALRSRPTGMLNVRGGSVSAASIVSGGGIATTINLSNATLTLNSAAGSVGSTATPINTLAMTNSTLNLAIGAFPPVATSNLVTSGASNTIKVTALPPVGSLPSTNILIQSSKTIVGSFNFVLGGLPAGYTGTLNTDSSNTAIQLVITSAPVPTKPVITGVSIQSGSNLLITGTNGVATSGFYVLSTTNVALPLNQWVSIATNSYDGSGNFSVTIPVSVSDKQRFYLIQSQ
jgi:hypothetical protein